MSCLDSVGSVKRVFTRKKRYAGAADHDEAVYWAVLKPLFELQDQGGSPKQDGSPKDVSASLDSRPESFEPSRVESNQIEASLAESSSAESTPLGAALVKKTYHSGTHRSLHPSETLKRLSPLLPHFGITRIANVTGLDRIGIPVVMVVRPNSRSVAVSQGKGLDLDSAKASGVMEAIETWHAERMTHALKLGSYAELRGDHAIADLDRIPQIDGGRFSEVEPLLWVEGRNLLKGEDVWLPYEMVHTNYTLPRPTGHGCFPASSNGLASGNHRLEATIHAICEVIERDATTLWHFLPQDRRAARRLDPESIDDPDSAHLLALLREADLTPVVWDTTTDVAVPAFYCLLLDGRGERGHMGAGAGCHPAKEIALSRALTEAVQTRTTYIAGSRDDLGEEEFSSEGRRAKYDYAERMMAGRDGSLDFRELPGSSQESFELDLAFLLERLKQAGIDEVIQVDLTKSEFEIPVVRVVIPGLEAPHDDDNFLPGPRSRAASEGEVV